MRQYSARAAKAGIPASAGKRALNTVLVGDASSILSILALLLITNDRDLDRHESSGAAVSALVELWTEHQGVDVDTSASSKRLSSTYEAVMRLRSCLD